MEVNRSHAGSELPPGMKDIYTRRILFLEKEVHLRRRKNGNSQPIKAEFGNLYVVKLVSKSSFIVFLPLTLSQSETDYMQEIELASQSNLEASDLSAERFAFNLNQIKMFKLHNFEQEASNISTSGDMPSIAFMLTNDRIIPPIYLRNLRDTEGILSLNRMITVLGEELTLSKPRDHGSLYLVIRQPSADLKFNINLSTRHSHSDFLRRFNQNPESTTFDEFSKLTSIVTGMMAIRSSLDKGTTKQQEITPFKLNMALFDRAYQHGTYLKPKPIDAVTLSTLEASRDVLKIKEISSLCGLQPDIRPRVWSVLTGLVDVEMSEEDQDGKLKEWEGIASKMYAQNTGLIEAQIQRNSLYRERKDLIEKDVNRIQQSWLLVNGKTDEEWRECITALLLSYVMFNHDVGYVQGMVDVATIVVNIHGQTISDSHHSSVYFGPFVALLENRLLRNFQIQDQSFFLEQLVNIGTLLKFIDPKLYQTLERNDTSNMYFCFRWIFILFAREFELDGVIRLWDCLRNKIVDSDLSAEAMLKLANDTCQRLDVDVQGLIDASVELYHQINAYKDLPESVRSLLEP